MILKFLDFKIQLGTWAETPAYLHSSWLFMIALTACFSLTNAAYIILIFTMVLLHEYGHIFAAKKLGYDTQDIILHPLGGLARIETPERSRDEFLVAIAGPAVSLAISILLYFLSGLHPAIHHLFWFNTVILLFNLLPIFPMDGGRMMRAIIHAFLGDYAKATRICAALGMLASLTLMGLSFAFGVYNVSAVCLMIYLMALAEYRIVVENSRFTGSEKRGTIVATIGQGSSNNIH